MLEVFLAFDKMKLTIDDHYRIKIPAEIIPVFRDGFAYVGVPAKRKDFSVMPVDYITSFGEEYKRLKMEHIGSNTDIRALMRTFFSHIAFTRVESGGRIVVPEKVRTAFWLVPGEVLEAKVVGQRMIISPNVD